MTKNERIQYLSDEIEDLKARVRYLETKPEAANPWTPIGPAPLPTTKYICPSCGSYSDFGHQCLGSPWSPWNTYGPIQGPTWTDAYGWR